MMPVYYDSTRVTKEGIESAKNSWKYIHDNLSPVFLDKKAMVEAFSNKYPTCLDWFVSIFFDRLFDIHPVSCSPFCMLLTFNINQSCPCHS